tara:strand:- start:2377 stop:2595 length:219 start_codon:yes stop_codon:yes gene_type:complete
MIKLVIAVCMQVSPETVLCGDSIHYSDAFESFLDCKAKAPEIVLDAQLFVVGERGLQLGEFELKPSCYRDRE